MEVDDVVSQLGCLQTQDREELVNQMLRLVGASINYNTAMFYLDMNQWNVQAAVCSYFDLETVNSSLPGMVFLKDVTIGEGDSIPPNTTFVKTWRVQNPGHRSGASSGKLLLCCHTSCHSCHPLPAHATSGGQQR